MSEKKYIDADEAFEIITDFAGQTDTSATYKAFWKAAKALKTQPSADVTEIAKEKSVDYKYLADWYQNSIDNETSPVWTDEHLEELLQDFYIIPKEKASSEHN